MSSNFNSLGLAGWLLRLCEKIGYKTPTPIQSMAIGAILKGHNVIGSNSCYAANAETGSGKTAAFAFPLLQRLSQDPYGVFCIVVTPSRELAIQIHQQFDIFGQSMNLRQALLIGGIGFANQEHQLDNIPHVVVGTPGRIAHMLSKNECFRKYVRNCEVMVLDQADRLFEDTLLLEMQGIFKQLPQVKQFVLATATIDNNFEAKRLKEILNRPDVMFEKFSTYEHARTVDTLIQRYILVPDTIKAGYLVELLRRRAGYKVIVFVKQCKQCHLLHSTLKRMEFKSCMLHSFMKQTRRFANLSLFKSGKADILITTDLSSRGLDIKAVDLVINYEIPRKLSDYVHRVGRTARKGMEGEAVTFVTQTEVNLFLDLEKNLEVKMEQEKLSEDSAIDNFRLYSRALRESKLELSNKGVLEQLDSLAEKKKASRDQLRNSSLP